MFEPEAVATSPIELLVFIVAVLVIGTLVSIAVNRE